MARHRLLRLLDREKTLVSFDGADSAAPEAAHDHLRSPHDPFVDLARDEVIDLVRQAVLALPAHFREVIVLCHLQEMNYADAAEVINCPIGTVRSRLARARTLLGAKLGMLKASAGVFTNINAERAI
jgi:RNA polymerase sigma-70 factor (ECF subfamily)